MGAVRHRFTVEEYRKMGEAGIFGEDDRVELVEGEVVQMTPIGDRHVESVMRLNRLLSRWAFGASEADLFVSVQNPLVLGEYGEPQPDLVVVRRSAGSSGTPTAREALLVVEVAATSLIHDRERKLPLYAASGIPEAWVVDLDADVVEVYSEPAPGQYRNSASFGRDDRIASANLPGLAFDASEALPPKV